MIRNLKLQGYRSFKSYELHDLARVNLLVGKNNSGKTSILEAVQFLASGGSPSVLRGIAGKRGEIKYLGDHDRQYRGRLRTMVDISGFMYGHRFGLGSEFSIRSSDQSRFVTVTVEEDAGDLHPDQHRLFEKDEDDAELLAVRVSSTDAGDALLFPATMDGTLHLDSRTMRTTVDALPTTPVQFVTASSLGVDSMRRMWDQVVLERRELEVIDALKLVEHKLDSIHFLSANGYGRGDIVLGLHNTARRTPIGSHGDGTRRLLALALSLTQLSGGVLLVDEIDTGLHWTVLEDLWRLVIEQATKASIQVFATTHSYDCIRGLASLAASRPDLATEFAVHKIERALKHSVGFDSTDVESAIDNEIELR